MELPTIPGGAKSFDAFDKTRLIGGTAKLTVGHYGEPNLLLQVHRGANAVVLNFTEFGGIDDAACERLERLTQTRRAEQTADGSARNGGRCVMSRPYEIASLRNALS